MFFSVDYTDSIKSGNLGYREFGSESGNSNNNSVEKYSRPNPYPLKGNNRSILIIDDEMMIRNLLSDILTPYEFQIETAMDGLDGLNKYLKNPFGYDLIILDMMMPVMDGETAFYRMKIANPDQKVLICSGYSETGSVKSMIDAGALGLLAKPFSLETLFSELRKHLG